jgi:hypothetical protein
MPCFYSASTLRIRCSQYRRSEERSSWRSSVVSSIACTSAHWQNSQDQKSQVDKTIQIIKFLTDTSNSDHFLVLCIPRHNRWRPIYLGGRADAPEVRTYCANHAERHTRQRPQLCRHPLRSAISFAQARARPDNSELLPGAFVRSSYTRPRFTPPSSRHTEPFLLATKSSSTGARHRKHFVKLISTSGTLGEYRQAFPNQRSLQSCNQRCHPGIRPGGRRQMSSQRRFQFCILRGHGR